MITSDCPGPTSELPKIINSRVAYLDPSFEAVGLNSHLSFSQDAHNILKRLRQFFPLETEGYELDETVERILA